MASMGPRSIERGIRRRSGGTSFISNSLQWGRARSSAESSRSRSHRGVLLASMGPRSIERGIFTAVKYVRPVRDWLQWGRARSSAESLAGGNQNLRDESFNGAALDRARNLETDAPFDSPRVASMGPRS